MANQAHRLGDKNTASAGITNISQNTVFTNELLQSIDGSVVAGHGIGVHAAPTTANGSNDVFVEGTPANYEGNPDTCGHPRAAGSPDVFIDATSTGIAGIVDNSVLVLDPFIRSDVTEFVAAVHFIDDPDSTSVPLIPHPVTSTPTPITDTVFDPPIDGEIDTPIPPPLTEIPRDCADIFEFESNYNFPTNFQLSPNFTVGSMTTGAALSHYSLRPQVGLTTNQIVCNMRMLCLNTLEPLKAAYPNMFITSGFRHGSGSSQHNRGEAADIQLSSTSHQEQWDAAKALTPTLIYDQFILELGNNYWFHVSYKSGSNRQQIRTRTKANTYPLGLIRLL